MQFFLYGIVKLTQDSHFYVSNHFRLCVRHMIFSCSSFIFRWFSGKITPVLLCHCLLNDEWTPIRFGGLSEHFVSLRTLWLGKNRFSLWFSFSSQKYQSNYGNLFLAQNFVDNFSLPDTMSFKVHQRIVNVKKKTQWVRKKKENHRLSRCSSFLVWRFT